jgi:hypothetical protein
MSVREAGGIAGLTLTGVAGYFAWRWRSPWLGGGSVALGGITALFWRQMREKEPVVRARPRSKSAPPRLMRPLVSSSEQKVVISLLPKLKISSSIQSKLPPFEVKLHPSTASASSSKKVKRREQVSREAVSVEWRPSISGEVFSWFKSKVFSAPVTVQRGDSDRYRVIYDRQLLLDQKKVGKWAIPWDKLYKRPQRVAASATRFGDRHLFLNFSSGVEWGRPEEMAIALFEKRKGVGFAYFDRGTSKSHSNVLYVEGEASHFLENYVEETSLAEIVIRLIRPARGIQARGIDRYPIAKLVKWLAPQGSVRFLLSCDGQSTRAKCVKMMQETAFDKIRDDRDELLLGGKKLRHRVLIFGRGVKR